MIHQSCILYILLSILLFCHVNFNNKKGNKDELECCVIQRQYGEPVVLWMLCLSLAYYFFRGKIPHKKLYVSTGKKKEETVVVV